MVLVAVMMAQRLFELVISARHTARIRRLGAVEYGAAHFPLIVAVHALFPVALLAETSRPGVHPGPYWPLWLLLFLVAQVLRVSSMRALGERWNVRVWVIPGRPPVRTGVYRRLRHPNYLAVAMEFVAVPLLFGAWRTAIVISALHAPVLALRIRSENDALQRAAVTSSR
jgi:methyltransferase